MKVRTQTEEIREIRKIAIELLLAVLIQDRLLRLDVGPAPGAIPEDLNDGRAISQGHVDHVGVALEVAASIRPHLD